MTCACRVLLFLKNDHIMLIMRKINIIYQGTSGITYKYLIYGHFLKMNISYQGTPGTTYRVCHEKIIFFTKTKSFIA